MREPSRGPPRCVEWPGRERERERQSGLSGPRCVCVPRASERAHWLSVYSAQWSIRGPRTTHTHTHTHTRETAVLTQQWQWGNNTTGIKLHPRTSLRSRIALQINEWIQRGATIRKQAKTSVDTRVSRTPTDSILINRLLLLEVAPFSRVINSHEGVVYVRDFSAFNLLRLV